VAEEARQRLAIEAKAEGFAEVSDRLNDLLLREAQLGSTAEEAAKNQDAVNLSLHDLQDAMRVVDPRMAGLTSRLLRFADAFGDLGKISVGEFFEKLAGGIGKAGESLKLLGAAGVAAAGILTLVKVLERANDEFKELDERMTKLQERQTTEEEGVIAKQREITALSRKRREGGFGAEEEAAAAETFAAIQRRGRIPRDLTEALQQNVAALTGIASPQEIEQITLVGEQIDVERRRESRGARARRILGRPGTQEELARELDRQRAEQEGRQREAAREAATTDPTEGLAHLREMSERESAGLPADPAKVEELLREAGRQRVRFQRWKRQFQLRGSIPTATANDRVFTAALEEGREPRAEELVGIAAERQRSIIDTFFGFPAVTPGEVTAATNVLSRSDSQRVTINDYRNAKFLHPSTRAQREASKNGESYAAQAQRD
jgi:hypothetical protein